eukprot:PhF_6_TR7897/c0_g5_i1/m.11658
MQGLQQDIQQSVWRGSSRSQRRVQSPRETRPAKQKPVETKTACPNKVYFMHHGMVDDNKCNLCGRTMASNASARQHVQWGHCPATKPLSVEWKTYPQAQDLDLFVSRPEGPCKIERVPQFKYLG